MGRTFRRNHWAGWDCSGYSSALYTVISLNSRYRIIPDWSSGYSLLTEQLSGVAVLFWPRLGAFSIGDEVIGGFFAVWDKTSLFAKFWRKLDGSIVAVCKTIVLSNGNRPAYLNALIAFSTVTDFTQTHLNTWAKHFSDGSRNILNLVVPYSPTPVLFQYATYTQIKWLYNMR